MKSHEIMGLELVSNKIEARGTAGGAAWGGGWDSVPVTAPVPLCCYFLFVKGKNTWGRKEREDREKEKREKEKKRNGKFSKPGNF
jgi:hypothetical protein